MGLKDIFKKRGGGRDADAPELKALMAQLDDSDWKVRLAACRALQKLGPRAQPAAARLQDLIEDDNGDVCNAAAAALSEIERDT
ncbi:MAG: HEAT repeat domain-containing protein [Planctomycetes bacterium]|nr:HEAT repeat domain-containing protein [Planctomycetota bacterium]